MLEVIARIAHPSDLNSRKHRVHLEAENYYPVYQAIARERRPSSILELGVRYGYSGCVMLQASGRDASYVGIDRQMWGPKTNDVARHNLQLFTRGSVTVIDGDTCSPDTASKVIGMFDLIHFDACHDTDGMLKEFDLFLPKLAEGGVVIVDDCQSSNCRKAVDTLVSGGQYRELDSVDSLTGLVLLESS